MGTEVQLHTPAISLSVPIELEAECRASLDFGRWGVGALAPVDNQILYNPPHSKVSIQTELSQFFHCCIGTYVTNSVCRLYTHQNVLYDMPKAAMTCLSNMLQETDGNVHGGLCGLMEMCMVGYVDCMLQEAEGNVHGGLCGLMEMCMEGYVDCMLQEADGNVHGGLCGLMEMCIEGYVD